MRNLGRIFAQMFHWKDLSYWTMENGSNTHIDSNITSENPTGRKYQTGLCPCTGSYEESENCLLPIPLTDYFRFPCSPQVTAEPWAGLWSQRTHAHKVPQKLWMCEFFRTIRSSREVYTTNIRWRHVLKHDQMDCGVKSILCPLRSWKLTGRHWSRGASGYSLKCYSH